MLMLGERRNMDWWGEDGKKAREKQEISSRLVSAREEGTGCRRAWKTGRTGAEPHTRGPCPSPSGIPLRHAARGPFLCRSWMKWRRGTRSPWQSSTRSCRASERRPSLLLGRLSPLRASSPTRALRWVSETGEGTPWLEEAGFLSVLPFPGLTYGGNRARQGLGLGLNYWQS